MLKNIPTNIDSYIATFPKETQVKLKQIRTIIKKAAPKTEEVISYQMPAFKMHSVLVFFAGYKNHIGFYPCPSAIKAFQSEFEKYQWSKGAVQFPLDKPLPVGLITKMVKFRLKEDLEKSKSKKAK